MKFSMAKFKILSSFLEKKMMDERLKMQKNLLLTCIQNGNLNGVKNFTLENPQIKEVCNEYGKSVVALAVELGHNKIYDHLLSKGFRSLTSDNIKLESQSPLNEEIRKINKKHVQHPTPEHLHNLISKCRLSHNTLEEDKKQNLDLIMNTFDELNEIQNICILMKVLSNHPKLCIIFDFDQDTVEHMDPTKSKFVFGTTYPGEYCIYIGAKGLKDSATYKTVYGTIAHEFCHMAMDILYNNNCKPYHDFDDVRKDEFNRIVVSCREQEETCETIISQVFDYPVDRQHAELIVRVPHIFGVYGTVEESTEEQVEKLQNCIEIYSELFEFYEEIVFKDLKRELSLETNREIKNLNALFGELSELQESKISLKPECRNALKLNLKAVDKIIRVSSNCPQLTMKSIYEQLVADNEFQWSHIFVNLKTLKNQEMFKLLTTAFNGDTEPTVVIDCDDCHHFELVEFNEEFCATQRLVFVQNATMSTDCAPDLLIHHSWAQLTVEAQKALAQRQITFQGVEIPLQDILGGDSKAIESISLYDLLTKRSLKIGAETKIDSDNFYVERSLLPTTEESENNEKVRLVAAKPGMGKTTELKMMTKRLKDKMPSHWIVFIDLKSHVEVFQKDGKVEMKFTSAEVVASFLSERILTIEDFQKEVFLELFSLNKVVVLMDGLDEICPSFKTFVIALIVGIHKTSQNQLWISTRPHLVQELKNRVSVNHFKLQSFNFDEQQDFFRKFLLHKKVHENLVESRLTEIDKFLSSLKRKSWNESESIANPLLMRMIVDIFDDDDVKLEDSNYYAIYEKFALKMVNNLGEKGPEARDDQSFFIISGHSLFKFHQINAFDVIFRHEPDNIKRLMNNCIEKNESIGNERIIRAGLMYDDGLGRLQFIHKTFAEFFVSHYLFEKIFQNKSGSDKELEAFIKFFVNIVAKNEAVFMTLGLFLNDACEKICDLSGPSKLPTVVETILKCSQSTGSHEFFNQLVKRGCLNLIKLISSGVKQNSVAQKNSPDWLDYLPFRERREAVLLLWLDQKGKGDSTLMIAAGCQPLAFIEKLWSFADEIFDSDQLRQVLLNKNKFRDNILHLAVQNEDSDIFEFIVKQARQLLSEEEDRKAFLMASDKHGRNLLFHFLKSAKVRTFKFYLEQEFTPTEKKTLLNSRDHGHDTPLKFGQKVATGEVRNVFDDFVQETSKVL